MTVDRISTESLSSQIQSEEAKRNRCWDLSERWRALQETITWADAQQTPPRNSPQSCLARQRQHAARLPARQPTSGAKVAEGRESYGSQ